MLDGQAGRSSPRLQRAELVGERLRQHRHDAVGEIDRVAARVAPRGRGRSPGARSARHRRSRPAGASRRVWRSGSGSAHTASSKSRASSPSIVTSGSSRRSVRARAAPAGGLGLASAAGGNSIGMSCSGIGDQADRARVAIGAEALDHPARRRDSGARPRLGQHDLARHGPAAVGRAHANSLRDVLRSARIPAMPSPPRGLSVEADDRRGGAPQAADDARFIAVSPRRSRASTRSPRRAPGRRRSACGRDLDPRRRPSCSSSVSAPAGERGRHRHRPARSRARPTSGSAPRARQGLARPRSISPEFAQVVQQSPSARMRSPPLRWKARAISRLPTGVALSRMKASSLVAGRDPCLSHRSPNADGDELDLGVDHVCSTPGGRSGFSLRQFLRFLFFAVCIGVRLAGRGNRHAVELALAAALRAFGALPCARRLLAAALGARARRAGRRAAWSSVEAPSGPSVLRQRWR